VSSNQVHSFIPCLWYAPLGVRSAKRRHQSPEWMILSHINCHIRGEVIGFHVLLDSLYKCSMRASWLSLRYYYFINLSYYVCLMYSLETGVLQLHVQSCGTAFQLICDKLTLAFSDFSGC